MDHRWLIIPRHYFEIRKIDTRFFLREEEKEEVQKQKKKQNKKNMETTRQEQIKSELESEKQSLTKSDRELLKAYFGYLGLKDGRKQTKSKSDACLFVKKCLFPDEDEGINEEALFPTEELVKYAKNFPSIFPNDKKHIEEFLANDGLGLTDREQCAIIRTYQARFKKKKRDRRTGPNGGTNGPTDGRTHPLIESLVRD